MLIVVMVKVLVVVVVVIVVVSVYNQPRDRQHVYSSIEEDVSHVDSGGGEGVGGGCGGDRGGVGLQPAPRQTACL